MKDFIKKTWLLNRVAVGKDTEFTALLIQRMSGGKVHRVPSGKDCLTWIIPDEWVVLGGTLKDPTGKTILDFKKNPLYLASYSSAYTGTIQLHELKSHLYTNREIPNAIPYYFKWQYEHGDKRRWGFCIPYYLYKKLKPGEYAVSIQTEFKKGNMFINEVNISGKSSETILIGAHTCHPAMVNDGIACVDVALDIISELRKRKNLRYSYKFIFGPEYFTAAAYLSQFGRGNLKYGIFLDMLGNGKPMCFSRSFLGDTYIDKLVKIVFGSFFSCYNEYPYRGVWGNDEMFYDGPGFNIPMTCIGREYFENYHTSQDNLDNLNIAQLTEAKKLILEIIRLVEQDKRLKILQKGPLYFSRFDRNIFRHINSTKAAEVQICLHNSLSYVETSYKLNVPFDVVKRVGDIFIESKLAQEI